MSSENEAYERLFNSLDSKGENFIRAEIAAPFFRKSNLPSPILSKIWKTVDNGGKGYLRKEEFFHAMQLIIAAQKEASELEKEKTVSNELSKEDLARFAEMFDKLDVNSTGFLEGSEMVPLFTKSGLSSEVLAEIWEKSDLTHDGKLDKREFSIAMNLIQKQVAIKDTTPAFQAQTIQSPSQTDLEKIKNAQEEDLAEIKAKKIEVQKNITQLDEKKAKILAEIEEYKEKISKERESLIEIQKISAELSFTVGQSEFEYQQLCETFAVLKNENDNLTKSFEQDKIKLEQLKKKIVEKSNEIVSMKSSISKVKQNVKNQRNLIAVNEKMANQEVAYPSSSFDDSLTIKSEPSNANDYVASPTNSSALSSPGKPTYFYQSSEISSVKSPFDTEQDEFTMIAARELDVKTVQDPFVDNFFNTNSAQTKMPDSDPVNNFWESNKISEANDIIERRIKESDENAQNVAAFMVTEALQEDIFNI